VVDIDVDIEHSLVGFEQFEDGEDAVVDVAEPRGLGLLGVMEAARPVDSVGELAFAEEGGSG
jgi:hypothetical protein